MTRILLLAASALALGACAGGYGGVDAGPGGGSGGGMAYETPSTPPAAFDARDFAWSTAAGGGAIVGGASYHDGQARYACAGGEVLLTPETPWSRRRMVILYGSDRAAAAPVSIVKARTPSAPTGDYARFVRRARCDGDDRFQFRDLPDGPWYVITVVRPVGRAGEPIALTRRVETHGGPVGITLSRP